MEVFVENASIFYFWVDFWLMPGCIPGADAGLQVESTVTISDVLPVPEFL
jgi:hypothetical protein